MSLDSSSSLEDVYAAYRDAADYDVTGDVAKAKAFIVAVRHLLLLLPASATQGGESISISMSDLQKQLAAAVDWLAANDSTSTVRPAGYVRHADFRSFRR